MTGRGPLLRLAWRPFRLPLVRVLRTARGGIREKCGWLLRLEDGEGRIGWGEASALGLEGGAPEAEIAHLGETLGRRELEGRIGGLSPCLGFALGAALAELDGLVGLPWLPAPPSTHLLPAGQAMPAALQQFLDARTRDPAAGSAAVTLKWKVAVAPDAQERQLLELLLQRLPAGARLRLDANGGWDRPTAWAWAERLGDDERLQWFEQPLSPADQQGLEALAQWVPVALDESLQQQPDLRQLWRGWQVRRPSQEGDPRPLLAGLSAGGACRIALSTAFETGIGSRWIAHLAALQQRGSVTVSPGLAPGWLDALDLTSLDPEVVWRAVRPQ